MFSFWKKEPKYFSCNNEIRIALIGKTGSGKSETGNTIIGNDAFDAAAYGKSVTKKCSLKEVIRGKEKIVVVDTPGLFDTDIPNEETSKELAKCVGLTSPGPHCFLVVIQVGRFSPEERDALKTLIHLFGNEAQRYFIVLFTKIDTLDVENSSTPQKNFQRYIQRIPAELKEILEYCGNRYMGFNNNATGKKKKQQVDSLLQMIRDTVNNNGKKCYSNEMYLEAESKIQLKMEQERRELEQKQQEAENRIRTEIRNETCKAKQNELEKELEKIKEQIQNENNEEELRRKIRSEIAKEEGSVWDTLLGSLKVALISSAEKIISHIPELVGFALKLIK